MGFPEVYDYAAGEADWFASGLPREGRDAAIPRVGDVARKDVPTCRLDDRIGDVWGRAQTTDWDMCLVVNEERVVLGRLRAKALELDPGTPVEQAMEAGPTTVRPDARLADVVERMRAKDVKSIVVTTSDGRLVGLLKRVDAESQPKDT
ncbi:MAG: CBS domain-containing protein [Chloroflexia bacterium]|nr:CBS domain-containing protein [Chloroflexia bacterium]